MPARIRRILPLLALCLALTACGGEEAVAPMVTPTVTVSRADAPIGSPIDLTFRFAVAPGVTFDDDFRVFVHFLDSDRELMWTDDHDPPVPTRQWKGGSTVEYTRTMFIPKFPYLGEATVQVGLHAPATGERVPMDAPTRGLREYDVATFNMTPLTDNLVVVFKDGWNPTEVSGAGVGAEWQWSKREGVLAFRNPKRATTLLVDLDQPVVPVGPQQVEVRIGETVVDAFELAPGDRQLRRIAITPEQLGDEEAVDVTLAVARSFTPAELPELNSADRRELGIRVFRAYIEFP